MTSLAVNLSKFKQFISQVILVIKYNIDQTRVKIFPKLICRRLITHTNNP